MCNSVIVEVSLVDTSLATSSAAELSSLRFWSNLMSSNSSMSWIISWRYFFILSSFTSYSLVICLTINLESVLNLKFLIPRTLAFLRLARTVLHSASLFVARN